MPTAANIALYVTLNPEGSLLVPWRVSMGTTISDGPASDKELFYFWSGGGEAFTRTQDARRTDMACAVTRHPCFTWHFF